MLPPVAPIADGAGGPIFNGPHSAEPSWNSLIKMVSSSTENNGPQTVRLIIQQAVTYMFTKYEANRIQVNHGSFRAQRVHPAEDIGYIDEVHQQSLVIWYSVFKLIMGIYFIFYSVADDM